MKWIAIFLLIVCMWDLIKPFLRINRSLRSNGLTWKHLLKYKRFYSYGFAVIVNLVAVIFFINYLR